MRCSLILRYIHKGIPVRCTLTLLNIRTLRYMCGLSIESSLRRHDVCFLFYGEISQLPLLEWLVC